MGELGDSKEKSIWLRKGSLFSQFSQHENEWTLLLLLSRFSHVRLCATP